MPNSSAVSPGYQATGFSINPNQTNRFDNPAVLDSNNDQAKPTMTSDKDSTDIRKTSQTIWARRRMREIKYVKGNPMDTQIAADSPAIKSENTNVRPKRAV